MLRRDLGLTKLYNLVNDPDITDESDADVARLRAIHVELDRAVMDAYGWADVDLDHGFHTYRQMQRWTVSPAARVEILDRLLEENHRRAAAQGSDPPRRRSDDEEAEAVTETQAPTRRRRPPYRAGPSSRTVGRGRCGRTSPTSCDGSSSARRMVRTKSSMWRPDTRYLVGRIAPVRLIDRPRRTGRRATTRTVSATADLMDLPRRSRRSGGRYRRQRRRRGG